MNWKLHILLTHFPAFKDKQGFIWGGGGGGGSSQQEFKQVGLTFLGDGEVGSNLTVLETHSVLNSHVTADDTALQ